MMVLRLLYLFPLQSSATMDGSLLNGCTHLRRRGAGSIELYYLAVVVVGSPNGKLTVVYRVVLTPRYCRLDWSVTYVRYLTLTIYKFLPFEETVASHAHRRLAHSHNAFHTRVPCPSPILPTPSAPNKEEPAQLPRSRMQKGSIHQS